MAILVTGGAGFIGSHVVARLLATTSDRVIVLDNLTAAYAPDLQRTHAELNATDSRLRFHQGSYGDRPLIERLLEAEDVRRIVHLGGSPGVRESVEHPHRYFENNVDATLTLLEAARRRPVERFLYASSSTVYGRGTPAPFLEDGPLGVPLSPYGASKRAAEILSLTYHGLHAVPITVLRLFNVYGPRLRPELALSVFTRAMLTQTPIPLFGDGTVRRDFAHVDDVSGGIAAALFAEDVAGQIINLGHNRPVTIAYVIELLEQAVGRRAVIDRRPARPEEMPVTCADLTKAKRLLGYEPRVPIEQGIADFVRWYRQSYKL